MCTDFITFLAWPRLDRRDTEFGPSHFLGFLFIFHSMQFWNLPVNGRNNLKFQQYGRQKSYNFFLSVTTVQSYLTRTLNFQSLGLIVYNQSGQIFLIVGFPWRFNQY